MHYVRERGFFRWKVFAAAKKRQSTGLGNFLHKK
jgi:hypothetical protein